MPWVPTWGKLPVETTPLTDPSGVIVGGYTACGCFRVRKRRTAIIVMLCVIFWTIVSKDSSNVALESALPAFEKYDVGGMGSHLVAVLPGTAACFYALGKGSAAILSFWFGGRNVLAYVQCLFGALCVLIITTGEPTLVLLGAIGANFSSAHGWAATSHVIANWMHSNEVGRTYALFGLAGSGGSVLAAFAYGAILDVPPEGSQWRWMFFVAASCLLLGAILVFALLRSSSRAAGFAPPSQRDTKEGEERPHPLDDASLWLACGAFVRSPRCCLMISVCCGYAVSTGVVYAFLPLYAVDALGATEGNAARLLPWLLVGSCVGSVGMGIFRDYASERKVVVLTGLLNLLAAAAVLGWVLHETGVNRWLTMESLGPICFIIGASMEGPPGPSM